jgi:transposase
MEACGASHHWARELQALGHEVVLIPPNTQNPMSIVARTMQRTPRRSARR